MAKKKSSSASRKRTPVRDLPSSARGAGKVKGGSLLVSTKPVLASPQLADGNGQPPNTLRK
jgi:hypothetical protein